MNEGDTVTLAKNVPRPEDYELMAPDSYYYVNQETGRKIIDTTYEAKVERRNRLANHLEEVEPYED